MFESAIASNFRRNSGANYARLYPIQSSMAITNHRSDAQSKTVYSIFCLFANYRTKAQLKDNMKCLWEKEMGLKRRGMEEKYIESVMYL